MKYYGKIGYVTLAETSPGVWTESVTERTYCGDVTRKSFRWQNNSEKLNDDIDISNTISIVADPYAFEHFGDMRYVTWMNSKWNISSVEVQYPRLILSIGGVYNGKQD